MTPTPCQRRRLRLGLLVGDRLDERRLVGLVHLEVGAAVLDLLGVVQEPAH